MTQAVAVMTLPTGALSQVVIANMGTVVANMGTVVANMGTVSANM